MSSKFFKSISRIPKIIVSNLIVTLYKIFGKTAKEEIYIKDDINLNELEILQNNLI